jgi:hypothetical protein
MNTKSTAGRNPSQKLSAWLVIGLILVLIVGIALFITSLKVDARTISDTTYTDTRDGGECFADHASGDFLSAVNPDCIVVPARPAQEPEFVREFLPVSEQVAASVAQDTGDSGETTETDAGDTDGGDAGNDDDSGDQDKEKSNNGNHYGNDKPDQNDHDDQNKHDGEQTKEDHHDNNGNDKK